MATVQDEDVPEETVTIADQFGHIWQEVRETPRKAVDMAYHAKPNSGYPIVLLLTIVASMAALHAGGNSWALVVGLVAVVLLTLWIGAFDE